MRTITTGRPTSIRLRCKLRPRATRALPLAVRYRPGGAAAIYGVRRLDAAFDRPSSGPGGRERGARPSDSIDDAFLTPLLTTQNLNLGSESGVKPPHSIVKPKQ